MRTQRAICRRKPDSFAGALVLKLIGVDRTERAELSVVLHGQRKLVPVLVPVER